MRYQDVENITFTAIDGKDYQVKDLRLIPEYTVRKIIKIIDSDMLDEIASRDSIFGEFAEDQTYKLFEANVTDFFDARLDLNNLKSLKVPF